MVKQTLRAALIAAALLTTSTVAAQDRVYVFDEVTVRGEIEKPEAFYILSPSNLEYVSLDAEASFLPALYETVEELPF